MTDADTVNPAPAKPTLIKRLVSIAVTAFALLMWVSISTLLGIPGIVISAVAAVGIALFWKRLPALIARKTAVVMLTFAVLGGVAGHAAHLKKETAKAERAVIFADAEAIHQREDAKAALAKLDELEPFIDRTDDYRREALRKSWRAEIGAKFTGEVAGIIAKARASLREGHSTGALAALDAITGDALLAPNAGTAVTLKETIKAAMDESSIKKLLQGLTTLQLEALADAGMTPEMAYHTDPDVSACVRAQIAASRDLAANMKTAKAADAAAAETAATSAPWTVETFTSSIPILAERVPKEGTMQDGSPHRMWSFEAESGDLFTGLVRLTGLPNAITTVLTSAAIYTGKDEKKQQWTWMAAAFSAQVISKATGMPLLECSDTFFRDIEKKSVVYKGFKIGKSVIKANEGGLIMVEITPVR